MFVMLVYFSTKDFLEWFVNHVMILHFSKSSSALLEVSGQTAWYTGLGPNRKEIVSRDI